jgi:hypothetical protein
MVKEVKVKGMLRRWGERASGIAVLGSGQGVEHALR